MPWHASCHNWPYMAVASSARALRPVVDHSSRRRSRASGAYPAATVFYRQVMRTLNKAEIPFLVGGTYALAHFTGMSRPTKDLDIFVRRESLDAALAALEAIGHRTDLTHPHFLGKAHAGPRFVDVIFASGNGSCPVDDWWFEHAPYGVLFGLPVRFSPIEEMIWSKAYVMERERFDGHDVAHLLRSGAEWIDWPRLVWRFGSHWRVLLAHLILFGFIYPGERKRIPDKVLDSLVARLHDEDDAPENAAEANLCRGTLLSRSQYLVDVQRLGFADARVEPIGLMTAEQTALWTKQIDEEKKVKRSRRS
jgi:hypothetical protein